MLATYVMLRWHARGDTLGTGARNKGEGHSNDEGA